MEFDLENPLTNFDDFFIPSTMAAPSLFLVESDHMATDAYINSDIATSIRREAISLISMFSCRFSPFQSYLAVNYLDRFLSSQGLLPQPKTWVLRLVAISCVSLAAKMNKIDFSLTQFQDDEEFVFDVKIIERMEYLILGALKWRMRSVTPFSFISFFVSFFNLEDDSSRHVLKDRAIEIIFKTQTDIKVLEFKPSIIAASALLFASYELFPLQSPCFTKTITGSSHVNKENMLKCYDSIFDMVSSTDKSEDVVISQQFSSLESEIDPTNVAVRTERNMKRRKINEEKSMVMGRIQRSTSLKFNIVDIVMYHRFESMGCFENDPS